jgi:hypothetical protein
MNTIEHARVGIKNYISLVTLIRKKYTKFLLAVRALKMKALHLFEELIINKQSALFQISFDDKPKLLWLF